MFASAALTSVWVAHAVALGGVLVDTADEDLECVSAKTAASKVRLGLWSKKHLRAAMQKMRERKKNTNQTEKAND